MVVYKSSYSGQNYLQERLRQRSTTRMECGEKIRGCAFGSATSYKYGNIKYLFLIIANNLIIIKHSHIFTEHDRL